MSCDKKIILLELFLLLSFRIISAQTPQSKIEKLQLGNIHAIFSVGGTDISTDIWGRFSKNKFYPWVNFFNNPALISGERSPKIILHFAPELSYGLTKLSGISSLTRDKLDNAIEAYRTAELNVNYPSIDWRLKRRMNWPDGLMLFSVKNYQIGLSIHHSFSASVLFNWIGNETTISTILNSGGGNSKVSLNSYLDSSNQLDYFVTSSSFIISKPIGKKYVFGFQAVRHYYDLKVSSNWNIQGSMLYNGKEFLFNDPETLWPTDITQRLQAHYSGVGWQVNLGGIFVANSSWMADASFGFLTKVSMTGDMTGKRNKIPALNVEALQNNAGVDEILDAEKLNPSQLTLTQSVPWEEHATLKQTMPVQLKIGLMHVIGDWGFYFSDKFYFGKYRWQYGEDFVELSPLQHIKFYVSRKSLFVKLTAYLFKIHSPDDQDFAIQSGILAVPSLSFGYCKKFRKQLALIGSLGLLPIPGVNLGVQYEF